MAPCYHPLVQTVYFQEPHEIFNTDQGSQFTSEEFTGALDGFKIRISMDGKGRWVDNVFTERLWRSLKQNEIYRNEYTSPREALEGMFRYFRKCNSYDPHQSLGYLTPDETYYGNGATEIPPIEILSYVFRKKKLSPRPPTN